MPPTETRLREAVKLLRAACEATDTYLRERGYSSISPKCECDECSLLRQNRDAIAATSDLDQEQTP